MLKISGKAIIFILVLITSGCVSVSYFPPEQTNNTDNYIRIINKSYDETWHELIQYSAGTFFSIDNFEKESGLLTLSFGASKPSIFITGGQFEATAGSKHFAGDYVDHLTQHGTATLNGKMNIVLSRITDNKTEVMVNARYVFIATIGNMNHSYSNTWSFDTGNCCTINVAGSTRGSSSQRTICPTYQAELAIIDALDQMNK